MGKRLENQEFSLNLYSKTETEGMTSLSSGTSHSVKGTLLSALLMTQYSMFPTDNAPSLGAFSRFLPCFIERPFKEEMLKDNGDVQDTSTYNFFMTDEEIKILCKNLVND